MKMKYAKEERTPRAVKIWLIVGLCMIAMQVVIGGITRLTGSGLSITRWEIVTGSVPPLSEAKWESEFELYRQTPQYQKINRGMSLSEFKFIYFWEYFHRLWARLMGLVFIFPFLWFLWRGMLSRRLMLHLIVVVVLAGLEGFFGWIMVASGLIHRPWVNAYNLTLHLCMALVIFGYLLWTIFIAYRPQPPGFANNSLRRMGWWLVGIAFFQIALGAMMSGSKAGLFYPTWPDMKGEYFPAILLDGSHWVADSFIHYDTNPFMPALIQFLHRNTAYLLTFMVLYFAWRMRKIIVTGDLRTGVVALVAALLVQVLLGIVTLINCQGAIPVDLGVLHQAGAVLLFGVLLYVNYQMSGRRLEIRGS
ncbi:MAG: COX15/CtaA family protein [Saprospiraceae bacterium]|nr:COX15/CtaA family protein [Saprospiraceae bacterium]